jgi:tetratricopeptide (TPR) repeat protein
MTTTSTRVDHFTYLKQPACDYLAEGYEISNKLHNLSETLKLLSSTIQENNKSTHTMLDKGLNVSEEINALNVCQTETIELLQKVAGEIEAYGGYGLYSNALAKIEEYEFAQANCNFYLTGLIQENAKLIEQSNNYFDETLSIYKEDNIPFSHVKKLCVLLSGHFYKVQRSHCILIDGLETCLGKKLDIKWKNIKKLLVANFNFRKEIEHFERTLILSKNEEIFFTQVEQLSKLVSKYKAQIEKPTQYLLKTLGQEGFNNG